MLVATWNVNSILARIASVTRWLDSVKPDMLCMQEIKCTDDKFPSEVFQERGYQCQIFGQQTYNGVAILTRDSCVTGHRGYPGDDETAQSRLIATEVNGINIVDVYIRHLRSKIDDRYPQKLIQTVRGIGYMIEAPEKAAERPGAVPAAPPAQQV
jgi:exodeoxyribonuclease-3